MRKAPFRYGTLTLQNAVTRMIEGYRTGMAHDRLTCYAFVGATLAEQAPTTATIRFWGRDPLIVHADLMLPSGPVSSMASHLYDRYGYELVHTMTLNEFHRLLGERHGEGSSRQEHGALSG
jgi:hypothetical protein